MQPFKNIFEKRFPINSIPEGDWDRLAGELEAWFKDHLSAIEQLENKKHKSLLAKMALAEILSAVCFDCLDTFKQAVNTHQQNVFILVIDELPDMEPIIVSLLQMAGYAIIDQPIGDLKKQVSPKASEKVILDWLRNAAVPAWSDIEHPGEYMSVVEALAHARSNPMFGEPLSLEGMRTYLNKRSDGFPKLTKPLNRPPYSSKIMLTDLV